MNVFLQEQEQTTYKRLNEQAGWQLQWRVLQLNA